mgnify:CR=1 FL=1
MSLIEAQVGVELREVLLKEKPPGMLEASAKGTVPVLLPSGNKDEVIDESLDIMLWALTGTNTEWLSGPMTQLLFTYPERPAFATTTWRSFSMARARCDMNLPW